MCLSSVSTNHTIPLPLMCIVQAISFDNIFFMSVSLHPSTPLSLTQNQGDPDFNLKPKKDFDFLKPLVDDMCQDNPAERPKMDEVVVRFSEIQRSLSSWTLRSRVAEVDEHPMLGFFRSIRHWVRCISYIIRPKPAIPSPSSLHCYHGPCRN